MAACSNSGGYDYYNTNDPLDDKSPSAVRQQVRDVWNELGGQMRDAICYDVAVLAPAAAISLLQAGGDQLGPGEAEVAYYEYRELCG